MALVVERLDILGQTNVSVPTTSVKHCTAASFCQSLLKKALPTWFPARFFLPVRLCTSERSEVLHPTKHMKACANRCLASFLDLLAGVYNDLALG